MSETLDDAEGLGGFLDELGAYLSKQHTVTCIRKAEHAFVMPYDDAPKGGVAVIGDYDDGMRQVGLLDDVPSTVWVAVHPDETDMGERLIELARAPHQGGGENA